MTQRLVCCWHAHPFTHADAPRCVCCAQVLGEEWKALSPEERAPFAARAVQLTAEAPLRPAKAPKAPKAPKAAKARKASRVEEDDAEEEEEEGSFEPGYADDDAEEAAAAARKPKAKKAKLEEEDTGAGFDWCAMRCDTFCFPRVAWLTHPLLFVAPQGHGAQQAGAVPAVAAEDGQVRGVPRGGRHPHGGGGGGRGRRRGARGRGRRGGAAALRGAGACTSRRGVPYACVLRR